MANQTGKSGKSVKRKPLYPRAWGGGNVAYVGTFRAFSMAVLGRSSLEIGDKIILPQQALQSINRLRLPFPLIFQVRKFHKGSSNALSQNQVINQYKRRIENIYRSTNPIKINKIDKWLKKYQNNPHELYLKICKTYGILPKSKITYNPHQSQKNDNNSKQKSIGKQYCSVYEFSSPQTDSAYLPHWMMENLGIDEGDKIELQSQFNIEKGYYCKLQPFKQEFMDKVSTIGYKSTLEHSLRHYSVLSKNQRIVVEFNHFPYQCIVKETKPKNAISILGSTDLEIEFEEPLEINNDTVYPQNNQNNQPDQNDSDHPQDHDDNDEDEDDSSSLGLSDIENQSSSLKQCDIDGALLKKLGVPLDYNEQTNLATMIIENRKLQQENQSRFDVANNHTQNDNADDDNDDVDDSDNDKEEKEEEKQATISDEALSPVGPDDVKCNNCGKYIHKMSIQMHEVHCIRENVQCKICNQCIKKQDETQHFENYHLEITCICNEICIGRIIYDKHKTEQCTLRLVKCQYCDRDNITASNIEQHEIKCRERTIICDVCNKSYLAKNKLLHDCGIICVLCNQRIDDSKDKLLHLITVCPERRAICNYCGIFRKCHDMEEHRKFCGSRSEKCEKCNQFVSFMNMEPHLQSNCQWFNNKQLSSNKSNKNEKKQKNKSVQQQLESLDLNNPYIDQQLLSMNGNDDHDDNQENDGNDQSLFGLLKTNPKPNLIDTRSFVSDKQLCPHCIDDDTFMDQEEFQIHIALKHPKLVDDGLTQTIMASFNNPEIINKDIKKTRKLSAKHDSNNNNKWQCSMCTFVNSNAKRRCMMCDTMRPN